MNRSKTNSLPRKNPIWYAVLLLLLLSVGYTTFSAAYFSVTAQAASAPAATANRQERLAAETSPETDNKTGTRNFWHQFLIILLVAVLIGVLAGVYGIIHMAEARQRRHEVQMKIKKGPQEKDEK